MKSELLLSVHGCNRGKANRRVDGLHIPSKKCARGSTKNTVRLTITIPSYSGDIGIFSPISFSSAKCGNAIAIGCRPEGCQVSLGIIIGAMLRNEYKRNILRAKKKMAGEVKEDSGLVSWMQQRGVLAGSISETGSRNFVHNCISFPYRKK